MTALAEFQQHFQQFVLGGDFTVMRSIEDGPRGEAGPRLAIYHDGYRIRLIEALGDTFATLRKHLGEVAFAEICARYVEAKPSSFRNVRWYGGDFADFLRDANPYAGQPWLADLVRFDWALVSAFDAADAVPVTVDDLTRLPASAWMEVAFAFHPSVRRLVLSTNAPMLRRAVDREEPLPAADTLDEPVEWLVWRRGYDTQFRSLDAAEAAMLDAAIAGTRFPRICERAGEWFAPEEAPAQVALRLRQWVDDGLIVRLAD